jgi:hypothetical protein
LLLPLFLVGIIYHSHLTWFTQLLDEVGVIQAEVAFYQTIRPLNATQASFILLFVLLGTIHPIFPGVVILYMSIELGKEAMEISILVKQWRWSVYAAPVLVALNAAAVAAGFLDALICPVGHFGFHSLFHILMALYCFVGLLVLRSAPVQRALLERRLSTLSSVAGAQKNLWSP